MGLRTIAAYMALATSSLLMMNAQGQSISINFAANQIAGVRSDVEGAAGVLGNANWNNLEAFQGQAGELVNGAGEATGVHIIWDSNNTWASSGLGEENNTAPVGDDRNLMTGYLDTAGLGGKGVSLEVSGLDSAFEGKYDIYVYTKGGVLGRGGDYTINRDLLDDCVEDDPLCQSHVDAAAFDGTYILGEAGDYLLFEGIRGDEFFVNTFPLVGETARAPINAIEIVAVSAAVPLDCNGDGVAGAADLTCIIASDGADGLTSLLDATGILPGDLDADGEVAFADFLTLSAHFGQTDVPYTDGDVNGDGEVAFSDFLTLSANFGQTSGAAAASVPEPHSILLLIGGVFTFRFIPRK